MGIQITCRRALSFAFSAFSRSHSRPSGWTVRSIIESSVKVSSIRFSIPACEHRDSAVRMVFGRVGWIDMRSWGA
eukprot:COSAG01_NODE_18724_length_1057_cov_7.657439_3_plen_75_part_00